MNNELVLIIVVAVVANIALFAGMAIYARARRRHDADTAVPPSVTAPVAAEPAPVEAAAEGAAPSIAFAEGAVGASPAPSPAYPAGWREPLRPTPPTPDVEEAATSQLDDLSRFIDPVTGLTTSAGWDHVLVLEERRHGRYGRPATVVVIELDRLDALAERFGRETADRLIPAVADTIRRSSRSADVVARTDHATFRVLMPETDEIRAINFVERLRDACDTWLEASAVAVRLAVGWASAGPGADVRVASSLATERMYADRSRGRPAPGRPQPGPA